MIEFLRENIQDTISSVNVSNENAFNNVPAGSPNIAKVINDSTFKSVPVTSHTIVQEEDSLPEAIDTTLVCHRNSIADVTLTDSVSFIHYLSSPKTNNTVYYLVSETKQLITERKEALVRELRDGKDISKASEGYDWIIFVLFVSAFLFTIVRSASKNYDSALRFILFRRLKDPDYGETGGFFHWQSTLQNIVSFAVISLFIYHSAYFYNSIPKAINGFVFWAMIMAFIVVAFTLRYAICAVTGSLSGQRDVFKEYMAGICQSYHISALLIFILIVFITYINFIPSRILLMAGFTVIGLMYILRVIRLLFIFMNRNISFFYLILYLCALEILPVAIAIRYFSGPI